MNLHKLFYEISMNTANPTFLQIDIMEKCENGTDAHFHSTPKFIYFKP